MNKFVKISIILLGVVIIIGASIYFKLFRIGNFELDSVVINKVTVGSNNVVIDGDFSDGDKAFKTYEYQLVGTELYLNVKSVLVSKKYDSGKFNINIPINGSSVKNIYISDGKRTKVIYTSGN